MSEININFDSSSLALNIEPEGWCRVNRVCADESVLLGADTWDLIQEKLLKCISTPCASEVPEWVFRLSEGHYSLYRKKNNESIELMWQNPDAEFISSDIISESQRNDITELLNGRKPLSRMEIKKFLKEHFSIENIDRKLVEFTEGSKYRKSDTFDYHAPELIIIKNKYGKVIFNLIMACLQQYDGGYREKKTNRIEDNAEFPYFIISMDMFASGMRMGHWEHYENDISRLSNEISLDKQQDDFTNFKKDIERMLGA